MDVIEDDASVLLDLSLELCILFVRREFNTSKLSLDD